MVDVVWYDITWYGFVTYVWYGGTVLYGILWNGRVL